MSGDTKLKRTHDGLWMDLDTGNTYAVRRLARDARRQARSTSAAASTPVQPPTNLATTNVTLVGYTSPAGNLTPLQAKLFDRLTNRQGVSADDALKVLLDPANGYNKAASYGHMRAAGANHAEACIVISLNDPDVSLEYGLNRARGMNHADALHEALDR
jgi:hypothetical protein